MRHDVRPCAPNPETKGGCRGAGEDRSGRGLRGRNPLMAHADAETLSPSSLSLPSPRACAQSHRRTVVDTSACTHSPRQHRRVRTAVDTHACAGSPRHTGVSVQLSTRAIHSPQTHASVCTAPDPCTCMHIPRHTCTHSPRRRQTRDAGDPRARVRATGGPPPPWLTHCVNAPSCSDCAAGTGALTLCPRALAVTPATPGTTHAQTWSLRRRRRGGQARPL